MTRPTTHQIKQARDRVRSKGHLSDDTKFLSYLAMRDPECRECVEGIAHAALLMLELPDEKRTLLTGIINGAFIAALHIALEIEPV